MQVTNHQMHAMLECYSRKLIRSLDVNEAADDRLGKISDERSLSSESTREATMAKISRQVLDKVTDVVALSISQKAGIRNNGAVTGGCSLKKPATPSGDWQNVTP
jgi:hypothetical protein